MKQDISTALLDFYGKVLEPKFRFLEEKLIGVEGKLIGVEERLTGVEGKLTEHDDKFALILDHIDALYQRFERLEEEYRLIVHGMEQIEKAVGVSAYKPDTLRKDIASMKTKLSDLQKRLEQLEKQAARA